MSTTTKSILEEIKQTIAEQQIYAENKKHEYPNDDYWSGVSACLGAVYDLVDNIYKLIK